MAMDAAMKETPPSFYLQTVYDYSNKRKPIIRFQYYYWNRKPQAPSRAKEGDIHHPPPVSGERLHKANE